jgi:hypothetical protein
MTSILKVDSIQNAAGTAAMTIDSSGRVLQPALPCCNVKLTTSNSQDTSSPFTVTGTAIKFDLIEINQGSCYSASTGKFVCPVTGIYDIRVQLLTGSSTTTNHSINIVKEGAVVAGAYNGVDSLNLGLDAGGLFSCNANDEIEVQLGSGEIFLNASGQYNILSIKLVG